MPINKLVWLGAASRLFFLPGRSRSSKVYTYYACNRWGVGR